MIPCPGLVLVPYDLPQSPTTGRIVPNVKPQSRDGTKRPMVGDRMEGGRGIGTIGAVSLQIVPGRPKNIGIMRTWSRGTRHYIIEIDRFACFQNNTRSLSFSFDGLRNRQLLMPLQFSGDTALCCYFWHHPLIHTSSY